MGKPRGSYITIEAQEMTDGDDGYHREISEELAKVLRGMIPVNRRGIVCPQWQAVETVR